MRYHYVYRLTHRTTQLHYIGSRGCKDSPLNDLGHRYFTSSHIVAPLFRANPSDFRCKILRCFETRREALAFERKCHLRFDVSKNPRFYNQVIAGEKFVSTGPFTEDHKQKIGNANRGKKRPDLSAKNKLGLCRGVSKSDEHKQRLREAAIRRWSSPLNRQRQSETLTRSLAEKKARVNHET